MDSKFLWILFVVLIAVWAAILLWFPGSKSNSSSMQHTIEGLLVLALGLAIVFYHQWLKWQYSSGESFVNSVKGPGITGIVTQMLDTDTIKVPVGTATLTRDLVGVVSKIDNEDITEIARNLTVYYTTFHARSYTKGDKSWKNISPLMLDSTECGDIPIDKTHIQMQNTPSDDFRQGIYLGTNILTGPKSYHLGVDGNSNLTFFFMFKADLFTDPAKKSYEVLKTFANTDNNNGFSVALQPDSKSGLTKVHVILGRKSVTSQAFEVDPGMATLLQVVKSGNAITIVISHEKAPQDLRKPMEGSRINQMEDIQLSNKEMMINRDQIAGRVYASGFYNRAISASEQVTLSTHLFNELKKTSEEWLQYQYNMQQAYAQIQTLKACPLPKDICDACSEITDWSNFFNVVHTAREPCLKAIAGFCEKNPDHEYCLCWNPKYPLNGTNVCKNVQNYFTVKSLQPPPAAPACNVDLENLSENQLAFVRGKYLDKLCPASAKKSSVPAEQVEPKPEYIPVRMDVPKTTALPVLHIDESKYTDAQIIPERVTPENPRSKKIPNLLVLEEDLNNPETDAMVSQILENNQRVVGTSLKYDPTIDPIAKPGTGESGGFWNWMFGRS